MTCAPSHPDWKHVGRPKAEIDWNFVDSLLEGGCSGVEIASEIGINPHTLYDRCLSDNNIEFSAYSQYKSAKGEAKLRMQQYKKALGLTESGDNTQLIWLGKCRLKQSDPSLSNQNNAQKIVVEVKSNGLASGIDVSTSLVSDTDNQSTQ